MYLLRGGKLVRITNFFVSRGPRKPLFGVGDTLFSKAGYVVVHVGVEDVVEGHGGREVFDLGKSGLFGLFSLL